MYGTKRNDIYKALFDRLSEGIEFKTKSRELKTWSQVSPVEQPALFVVQNKESAVPCTRGLPTQWKLYVDVYIYCHTDSGDGKLAIEQINDILDKIDELLAINTPKDLDALGNMSYLYAIEGDIVTDEGYLGGQRVAIVPIVIRVNDREYKFNL